MKYLNEAAAEVALEQGNGVRTGIGCWVLQCGCWSEQGKWRGLTKNNSNSINSFYMFSHTITHCG